MTDKKYGDWHKIGKAVVDAKKKQSEIKEPVITRNITGVPGGMRQTTHPNFDYLIKYNVSMDKPVSAKLDNPGEEDGKAAAEAYLKRQKLAGTLPKIGEIISDLAPLAAAIFGDYDYHREQPYINPAKYIPVGQSIEPVRRAANESYASARYNQANLSPNTGAGMAYGLQAAQNRAKTIADAYKWQQDAQNKLIAQNVGIYNDWANREAQARHTAVTETRQNEAAADLMRKTDIKSGLDWYQKRRRDRQLLPAYQQYLRYGMYDDIVNNISVA